jgi:hypothetical protein
MADIRETVWANTTSQDVVLQLPGRTLMVPKDSMRAIASEFDAAVSALAPQLERMGEQTRPA